MEGHETEALFAICDDGACPAEAAPRSGEQLAYRAARCRRPGRRGHPACKTLMMDNCRCRLLN